MNNIAHIRQKDTYGSKLILSILVLFALMAVIMYKIQNNLPQPQNNGFIVTKPQTKTIYLLSSKASALLYAKNGSSTDEYKNKIKTFSNLLTSIGYDVKILPANRLDSLKNDSLLFVIDALALSANHKKRIKTFIKNGGKLFFNFTTGFSDENGKYVGDSFIHEITGLRLNKRLGFVSFKGDDAPYMTQKLLSPFSTHFKEGKLLNIILYDKIPLFDSPSNLSADMYITGYTQATPPLAKDKNKNLSTKEAGMGWHGYYGKGKWAYVTFPAYSFYDIDESREDFKKIIAGIIDFLSNDVIVQNYPYIDKKSVVFVSEDTEYKFENFQKFANLAKEYQIPVTAFIVASLANKPQYEKMMANIAKNPFVEFASHSTTHKKIVGESEDYIINETENSKKIIDKFTPEKIKGFRPPREELNDLMKKHLAKGGFTYILGANQQYMYPKFDKKESNLLYIPRHGTDDYSYLVNLDWGQKEIVNQMIKEAHFITKLNGIYTLSIHTHLFAYSTNIKIVEEFFKYLKEHPQLTTLNGREIFKRIYQNKRLKLSSKTVDNQLVITVKNDNDTAVKNLHIKLFKNPNKKIVAGEVDDEKATVKVSNKNSTVTIDTLSPKSVINIFLTLREQNG